MLTVPRSLARRLRAVGRRCLGRPGRSPPPAVEFHAGPDGLRARLAGPEAAAEYLHPGAFPAEVVSLPAAALADFEGRGDDAVTLEAGGGKVLARWQDGGVPRAAEYDAPGKERQEEFPGPPGRLSRNPPGLLHALDEAARGAATEHARYSTHRILLRGRTGEVVATDGRQLLIQSGFTFPFADDLLVPALPVFAILEAGEVEHVEVGRSEWHAVVRAGPWAFWLKIDAGARYPDFMQVVPRKTEGATVWRIDAHDAAFLARALPRLPGGDDDHRPVTVDLGARVCVRARAKEGRTAELALARSAAAGRPLRLCVDRRLLARLLHLGFAEVLVLNPDAPFLCRDAGRTFVGMPLAPAEALGPAGDALRLAAAAVSSPDKSASPGRRKQTVNTPQDNGHAGGNGAGARAGSPAREAKGGGFGAVIAEAQALKEVLGDAYRRSGRLVAGLRRFRQQSRAVANTLASLRQLQRLQP